MMEQIFLIERQPAVVNEEYQRACLLHRASFENRHLIYLMFCVLVDKVPSVTLSSFEK